MSGTAGGGALRLRVRGLASPRPSRVRSVGGGEPGGWHPSAGAAKQVSGSRRRGWGRAASEGGAGTSCARRLCEPRLGPPALPAAILFSCCFLFAAGPSLSPSRAGLLLARCPAVDRRRRRVPAGPCSGPAPPPAGRAGPAAQVWAPSPSAGGFLRAVADLQVCRGHMPLFKSPWLGGMTEPGVLWALARGDKEEEKVSFFSSPSPGASSLVGAAKVAIQLGFG